MNDEKHLTYYYQSQGYKDLGCINISKKASDAYQKSKDRQEHQIGRNYYLIACHDLKVFMTVDSGD